jgi:predicted phage terminase large subunit-like protein
MTVAPSKMYAEVLRGDFNAFVHRSFLELHGKSEYLSNWHLEVLAAKLEDVRHGRCRRLIINIPPRHLKSHMATIVFPAWLLGHDPSKRILTVCYAQDLSEKFARDSRTLINSPFYRALFETRLSSDRQAVSDFETTEGGYRLSSSISGGVTGFGADIIIVDDPMKAADALSDVRRDSLNEWFDNTLRSRLNSQETGAVIIVMQRLHADDLVAHVQENEKWDVLSFPVIAIGDTDYSILTPYGRRTIRRREGDVLQPALLPLARLEELRHSMTEYNFSAQYQQNPTPRDGNMIKTGWLEYYEPSKEPGKFDRIFQSWDTANKAGELNDFSVCTIWGVVGKKYYLLDVFRKKLNYPDLKYAVMQLQKLYPSPVIIIEDNASGTQLIQDLKREGRMLIKPYLPPAGTDKELRVDAQSIHFENRRVFLRRPASWLMEYVAELTGFPNMRFDDQVDSTVQFLDYVNRPGAFPMVISKELLERAKLPGPRSRHRF